MNEQQIKKIMDDPNTWCWDGCTYTDFECEREDWEDEFDRRCEEILRKARAKAKRA